MKYLTPEIAALSKKTKSKSLVRSNLSCGIFQDCDYNEERPVLYHQKMKQTKNLKENSSDKFEKKEKK